MSSTGGFSRTIILPTTGNAEQGRNNEASQAGFPGLHEGVRMAYGTISEVHESRSLVKAYADDTHKLANGKWIPLCHSPREIAERFGKLKRGMRIICLFSGPDGSTAFGLVCGEEGEKNANTPVPPNNAQQRAHKIFGAGGA